MGTTAGCVRREGERGGWAREKSEEGRKDVWVCVLREGERKKHTGRASESERKRARATARVREQATETERNKE